MTFDLKWRPSWPHEIAGKVLTDEELAQLRPVNTTDYRNMIATIDHYKGYADTLEDVFNEEGARA